MLGKPNKKQQMFNTFKAMFPHIDFTIINQHLTFSQNLQNLVLQLGTPNLSQTHQYINNMKEAVDMQQLKIQKSLVNEQDVLGNITNRSMRRNQYEKHEIDNKAIPIIEQSQNQQSQCWNNNLKYFVQEQNSFGSKHIDYDIISDIWQLNHDHSKEWFRQ